MPACRAPSTVLLSHSLAANRPVSLTDISPESSSCSNIMSLSRPCWTLKPLTFAKRLMVCRKRLHGYELHSEKDENGDRIAKGMKLRLSSLCSPRNPSLRRVVCRVKLDDGDGNVTSRIDGQIVEVVQLEEERGVGWLSKNSTARLYLLLVPFMWGTYGPALRFIYSQPLAPSASIITLSRKVASVAFFLLIQPLEKAIKRSSSEDHNGAAVAMKTSTAGSPWGAAAELGFWTFLGTALQTNALGSTTATRAGFILQTITVLVPVISAASGAFVSRITWGAAFIALLGVFLMSLFGNDGVDNGSVSSILCSEGSAGCQSAIMGDLEVLAAAFFYAFNTIRLGFHAKNFSALELSTRVMMVSTAFTFGWAGYDYASASLEGRDGGLAWQGLTSPEVAGATIFAALAPGTLAHLAQAVGQKMVSPSEAQVYYSLQPVWSAIFAAVFLHESMSPLAWGAGGLVVFAALLASTQTSSPQEQQK